MRLNASHIAELNLSPPAGHFRDAAAAVYIVCPQKQSAEF